VPIVLLALGIVAVALTLALLCDELADRRRHRLWGHQPPSVGENARPWGNVDVLKRKDGDA
jgi:hypothetical protein